MIHLVDPHGLELDEIVDQFHVIRGELKSYSSELAARPIITALTKSDLVPKGDLTGVRDRLQERIGETVLVISSATREGVTRLLESSWVLVHPR